MYIICTFEFKSNKLNTYIDPNRCSRLHHTTKVRCQHICKQLRNNIWAQQQTYKCIGCANRTRKQKQQPQNYVIILGIVVYGALYLSPLYHPTLSNYTTHKLNIYLLLLPSLSGQRSVCI